MQHGRFWATEAGNNQNQTSKDWCYTTVACPIWRILNLGLPQRRVVPTQPLGHYQARCACCQSTTRDPTYCVRHGHVVAHVGRSSTPMGTKQRNVAKCLPFHRCPYFQSHFYPTCCKVFAFLRKSLAIAHQKKAQKDAHCPVRTTQRRA